jgi:hypothetical protein
MLVVTGPNEMRITVGSRVRRNVQPFGSFCNSGWYRRDAHFRECLFTVTVLAFHNIIQAHTSDPEDVNTSIDGANRFKCFSLSAFPSLFKS